MPRFNRDAQDTPQEFFKPNLPKSYAARLGYIGRQLDRSNMRSITIVEISGSFIIRSIERRSDVMVLNEVVAEDFASADYRQSADVNPASYEAMLRVIGEELDEYVAANIAIVERSSAFEFVGWAHGSAAGESTYVPFATTYTRADLQIWATQQR